MESPALVHQIPLKDLVEQILLSGKITRAEQDRLVSTLAGQKFLSPDQQAMIQRVFYGLRHGLLQVVD